MRLRNVMIPFVLLVAAALHGGCSEDVYIGTIADNRPPTIRLTSGPLEHELAAYRLKFGWVGYDPDGRVQYYEFVICSGKPIGFDPADTTGLDKWTRTTRTDSVFQFTADAFDSTYRIGTGLFSRYKKTHTFFVRAVDDLGVRSVAAYRTFTSWTLAPYVMIETPANPFPGRMQSLPPVVRFRWRGHDPIDYPWNEQPVDSVRYLLTAYNAGLEQELNKNPAAFEDLWSPWRWYYAIGDSGTSTIIGDDEGLNKQNQYLFAVQAMEDAGAVTSVFDLRSNVRTYSLLGSAGPILKIREPYLGSFTFLGPNNSARPASIPAGFPAKFSWSADAAYYGSVVSTFRYGWDIMDLSDPNQWEVLPSPLVLSAFPKKFASGVHTLYVEAVDNMGYMTLGIIEITTFAFEMDRNLLWVDDFYSTDFVQKDYGFPTESEHDAFWLHICSRADGFSPSRDVYDATEYNLSPPGMDVLFRYKNIIWTYSSSNAVNTWDDMVRFIPESLVGQRTRLPLYLLSYFVASGGHLWTEGISNNEGGLTAVLIHGTIYMILYPLYFKCEITGVRTGCDADTSGTQCFAYRDYCVSVIDKVVQQLRSDPGMPQRKADWDAMASAYRDTRDVLTLAHPGLPPELRLWDQVTKPGMFFDPLVRGFTYVELYNPAYWMQLQGIEPQSCLHPMFRMRSRNLRSAVNNQIVAFWSTKYADVVASAPGAVAAPNVHFGLPLWFFNRAQVDSIADVVFREWQIRAQ